MMKTSAKLLWKDMFFLCRINETRRVRLWTFNIRMHITVIMVNAVFIVTIPNLDSLGNYPFYYKILCSSTFNVQRATTRMEYFILFLHEIVLIKKGWQQGINWHLNGHHGIKQVICEGWHFTRMWKTLVWPHHFTKERNLDPSRLV